MPVLIALIAGALGALGQEPYGFPIVLLAAMTIAAFLYAQAPSARRAALIGWVFGFGYFAHALQWIVSPFLVDVARHGWMAPFALVLLAAGMALFWGVAFWGARRLGGGFAALIACWPAAELARAYVFTGFPWASPAQALVDSLSGQALALIGPHGLNVLFVAAAVLLAVPVRRGSARRLAQIVLGAALATTILLPPMRGPAALTDHTVRLVQPNAAQRDKWDPEKIPVFFNRQLSYTAAAPENGGPVPDLVLWSETAIPWRLDLSGSALQQIASAGQAGMVALGVQRRDAARYFNSMVRLGPDGSVAETYDKHHLVPFGEYVPLGDLAGRFGIHGLAAREGFGYSSGPGTQLMDFGPLGRALPLICYEAVFAHDVNAAPERPDFLIQITNDAWFGKGAGPRQHLAQARMRAIEQGLPLARAANTGISGMIDPYGRMPQALPLNTAGFVDAALPVPLPPTPYSRTGDLPLAVLLVISLLGLRFRSVGTRRD